MKYLSRENLNRWRGKTCLLRIDLNIEPGVPLDSYRLQAVLPTVKLLSRHKIRIILLSHRGRPTAGNKKQGTRNKEQFSLRPFASILQKRLKQRVVFVPASPHAVASFMSSRANVFLLENLRFLPGEEKNDANLARRLAKLGDFYVNDAFAVSHRKNVSVVAITKFLPSYGGLLLEREIENLGGILKYTTRPFVIVLGGAKAEDKLGIIDYFWNKADKFLFGGGPANTFFTAQGLPVGGSIFSKETIPKIKKYLNSPKTILPIDLKIADKRILDIGSKTIRDWSKIISKSRTIVWNGPMGLFEKKEFAAGTFGIWRAILRNKKAKTIVGGGETVASLQLMTNDLQLITKKSSVMGHKSFVSTGGGAMLEYLSGKKLPGIAALERASLAPENGGGKH